VYVLPCAPFTFRHLIRISVQKQFVQVVRAVEFTLGLESEIFVNANVNVGVSTNITSAMASLAANTSLESEVTSALRDAIPVLLEMVHLYSDIQYFIGWDKKDMSPLTTR
jgi:hypothetical protein